MIDPEAVTPSILLVDDSRDILVVAGGIIREAGYLIRTDINNVIGANIMKKIKKYPDHMHLITCGDAHIIHNPLHRFIEPPVGTFGIVDQNNR